MPFWVYILRCRDGSCYVGHTDNLEGRLHQHQQGVCYEWTRRRRPVELAWHAEAPTPDEALAFERRVKGWTGAKKDALIKDDWAEIARLARPPHERLSTISGRTDVEVGPRRNIEVGPKLSVRRERSAKRVVEGPGETPPVRLVEGRR